VLLIAELQFGFLKLGFSRGGEISGSGIQFGAGTIGRIENIITAFDTTNLTISQILFGKGFIIEDIGFIPSFASVFIYFGLAGTIFFGLMLLWLFLKAKSFGRVLVLCFILQYFLSHYFLGIGPIVYMPYIFILMKDLQFRTVEPVIHILKKHTNKNY
jgi:hypothetical protein